MFDTERFIVEIQDRPALYDVQSKDYANRELKAKLWMEIGQEVVAHWADLGPEDKNKADAVMEVLEEALAPRRTFRTVLTEIPVRTLRAERQSLPLTPLAHNTPIHDGLPPGYLSPSPSPDELVIQQRGRRRMPASWSPIDHKKNSPFRSALRTPPKIPPPTSPHRNGVVLRSTPRKRLMMNDEKPSASEADRTTPTKLVPGIKRLKIDRIMNGEHAAPVSTSLRGLNKNQMLEIFDKILKQHPGLEDEVKQMLPEPDLKPIEDKMLRLKRNVFKSLPSSRLVSRTDSPAYSRAHIHLTTFKKYVTAQGKKLVDSQHWLTVVDYVFLAWSYVRATPVWDNQVHNASRKTCFKILTTYCLTALKKGNFDKETLTNINDRLQSFSYDNDDIPICLRFIESQMNTK